MNYLSVDTTFFTIFDYPMSYLEFFGTILNLASVYLVARKNILTWPIGLVAVILFGLLFYQIRLYGDFIEQIYYFFSSLYGWWVWAKKSESTDKNLVSFSPNTSLWVWVAVTLVLSAVFSWILSNLHIWLPSFFPEATTYPAVDGFTTVASFVAMILMAHKRIECWVYWIVVNVIAVWLYYVKGVYFISLLYFIFLGLASFGLINWFKQMRNERQLEM
jgi:nicotinamide mononucleotide transporter